MDFKPIQNQKILLAIGALGALLLVMGNFWHHQSSNAANATGTAAQSANVTQNPLQPTSSQNNNLFTEEQQLDSTLTNILGQISGVYGVHVMVNLQASDQVQFAENTQSSSSTTHQGQNVTSTQTKNDQIFTTHNSDGSETPVEVTESAPQVEGVLVTVAAQDFILAKSEIINAITNVLDVPAYKISVEPQKLG
ncbi:hypothetical protein [Alicyclobacillus tolerans]|uniref:Stage III sporulation protein AG n=1 Tax=Alicyclobacillus tolerans TaxID=90970 RepID=A0A1M6S3U2_9BACL|nr:hypothetical protein [Alicyclobacillus montanus]SHK39385.1 stage III sporulation protein AG [Alicyclobacillus montanus]